MKEIDGNTFLMNVFLELIRRNKLEISFVGLIKLEYNFLELFEDEQVELQNSGDNIRNFCKRYPEYIEIIEKNGEAKIFISNEEEFRDLLLEEYEQDFDNTSKYRKALKMEINKEKKIA